MKAYTLLLTSFIIAFSLTACGDDSSPEPVSAPTANTEEQTKTVEAKISEMYFVCKGLIENSGFTDLNQEQIDAKWALIVEEVRFDLADCLTSVYRYSTECDVYAIGRLNSYVNNKCV
jgi:hypothetical protein